MIPPIRFSLIFIAVVLAGCISQTAPAGEHARIVRVIDGDTVVTAQGTHVRLLGINTPEKGRRYSDAARTVTAALVLNKTVTLTQGAENTGVYGRELRYVWANNTLVNQVLVADGLATTFRLEPDQYHQTLLQAEDHARTANIGMWMPSPHMGCVNVTAFHWNPGGNDNRYLNEEYVTFINSCSTGIDLTGWTVKDAGTTTYTFPTTSLPSHSTVTLHTGAGTNTRTNQYWGRGHAVWNNGGDTLYLRDANGLLVTYDRYDGY